MRHQLAGILILASCYPALAKAAEGEKAVRTDLYGDPLPEGAIARLGTGRLCQPLVNFLALSPDARIVFAAGFDGYLHLWEVSTGKQLPQFQETRTRWLALSPDGKTLVAETAGSARGALALQLWDVATGQPLRKLVPELTSQPVSMAFSPDGRYFALADNNSEIHRWDLFDSKPAEHWPGTHYPHGLAFSQDGRTLIAVGRADAGSQTKEFCVYETATGKELARHPLKIDTKYGGTLSPDGKIFAVPSPDGTTLCLCDPATGKELRQTEGPAGKPWRISFSADSRVVALAGQDGTVWVWETATGKVLHRIKANATPVHQLALSGDGKILAWTGRVAPMTDHAIHLWDLAKAKELHSFEGYRTGPLNAVFSADGKTVVTLGPEPDEREGLNWTVRQWDPLSGKELRALWPHLGSRVRPAVLSPDGTLVGLITADGTLHLWNTLLGKELYHWNIPKRSSLTFSQDSKAVLVTEELGIHRWDVATAKKEWWKRPAGYSWYCLPAPWDPSQFFIGGQDGLLLFDAANRQQIRRFAERVRPGSISLTLSPDGRLLGAVDGNAIRVWETASGGERWRWVGDSGGAFSVLAFSPDSRILAAGYRNELAARHANEQKSTMRLWHLTTGKPLGQFEGHHSKIHSLAFSPDGRRLVSAGDENTALVWDVTARTATEQLRPTELSPQDLDGLWSDLAEQDAAKAYRAMGRLVAAPHQAVSFLNDRLKPASPPSQPLDKLIAALDDPRFPVREKATEEIEDLGSQADVALRQLLAGQPSTEVCRRAERILAALRKRVSVCRAIEILEHIGTPEAKQVLQALANGAPEVRLTQEAKASLERLAKRHGDGR